MGHTLLNMFVPMAGLCVIYLQFTLFLAGLDKDIGVDRVEGGAANRGLLDEELQAVIAGGARS